MGRRPFRPTLNQRETVERLIATGASQDEIARAIGIERHCLAKHFEDELKNGAARSRAKLIDILWTAANKGNAGAAKTLIAMGIPVAGEAPEAQHHSERSVKLGKKEIAKQQAESAGEGTDWGSDLIPGTGMN